MVNHILKKCDGLIDENIQNENGLKVIDLKKEFSIQMMQAEYDKLK